jgi:DNA ligase-1
MNLLWNKKTQVVEHLYGLPLDYEGTNTKEIERLLTIAREAGKEGVMVKDRDGVYEWGRGQSIVKVKVFHDIDLKVIGFNEGTGKNKNNLGSLIVDYNGYEVGVGSGLTDEMRKEIWNNQKKYLGKTAEIIYFEETENAKGGKSLRFPVLKEFKEGL